MEKVINSYECMFVVSVANGEEATKATVSKFTDLIAGNAEAVQVDDWGKRRFAYPIEDMNEGYYTVVTFKSESAFPAELQRLMNIDESVLRSMVIRAEHTAPAKVEEAPAAEASTETAEAAEPATTEAE